MKHCNSPISFKLVATRSNSSDEAAIISALPSGVRIWRSRAILSVNGETRCATWSSIRESKEERRGEGGERTSVDGEC